MRPTRTWTLTVDVEDADDGVAFTEGMMDAYALVVERLAEDVPAFRATLTDTHGEAILGGTITKGRMRTYE